MTPTFVDTGHWIALFDPRDKYHQRARQIGQRLGSAPFVTSEMVLAEVCNHFAGYGAYFRVQIVKLIRSLQRNSNIEIVPQTPELFAAALELYEQRPDKKWGLVDCASFCIMQGHGITEALAYDAHFQQAGFVALLR